MYTLHLTIIRGSARAMGTVHTSSFLVSRSLTLPPAPPSADGVIQRFSLNPKKKLQSITRCPDGIAVVSQKVPGTMAHNEETHVWY